MKPILTIAFIIAIMIINTYLCINIVELKGEMSCYECHENFINVGGELCN